MTDETKKAIAMKQGEQGFIKTSDAPIETLNSEQKVVLNRKGNALFNEGAIEEARRIFTATGYSDGLTRVGDEYMKKNESLKALKQYVLAHNEKKASPLYETIAKIVSASLQDDNTSQN